MKNNPFAKVFRDAFYNDVLDDSLYLDTFVYEHPRYVQAFMNELNHFLRSAGENPILYQKYTINEHKLLDYSLFLRGYMRDSQSILANLQQKYATDSDLIRLFIASSEHIVKGSKYLNSKKVFDDNVGYRLWQIDMNGRLKNAHYKQDVTIDSEKNSLYLFMPFRIKDDKKQINQWTYANMRETLDKIGDRVNIYVAHYPIQKSRSSNIASLLKTLQDGNEYYELQDMEFVRKYWSKYVGNNVVINGNKVIAGDILPSEQLYANFGKITIFSYCAGTANAHRCLNALYDITEQLYGRFNAEKAMHNICMVSYGFLPPQNQLLYSGVHFYSNTVPDYNRKEPFANLNNHVLYEKTKCRNKKEKAKYTLMPDGRNMIISIQIPNNKAIIKDGKIQNFSDAEFGHSLINVNTPNIIEKDDFAYHIFSSVIEKSSLGYRGKELLSLSKNKNDSVRIINSVILSKMQQLS